MHREKQMAKNLMSKSQTGVFLFFYTMTVFLSATVFAADPPAPSNPFAAFGQNACAQLDAVADKTCEQKPPQGTTADEKNKYEKWKICYDELRRDMCGGSSSTRKCETSVRSFETAKKDFIRACADAKVKPGGRAGDIACAESMRRCTSCGGGEDSESLRSDVTCESAEVASDSGSSSADIVGSIQKSIAGAGSSSTEIVDMTPNVSEERARYANCPALAGAELKQWQDEYKESKKTVEDLQTKITKLQQELSDMQGKAEEENTKLQEQADDVQTKAKEDAQKAQENLEDKQREMAEQVTKLNDEITKENSALRQMDIGRTQAQTAFADTVSRLDLQCHASALQRLEAERQKKLQQMEKSEYSAGDMNSLFSGVGLSSRQKGQQIANDYFEFCKRDRAYTMALKSAQAAFNLSLEQAAEGRRNIQSRIQALNDRIDMIQKTDAYRNMQRTYDHLVKIQENMNKALDKLTRQKNQIQQQYTRNYQLKNKELQQQQAKLAEEENYLKKKKEFLAMKTKASKGIATTEDKVSDAMGKYSDLNFQANAVKNDCSCISNPQAGSCTAVLTFLNIDTIGGTGAARAAGTSLPPDQSVNEQRAPASPPVTVPATPPRPAATPHRGTR